MRSRAVAVALLVLLGIGFVAQGWDRIDAPFGDSDEGINGAVWGYGARALRQDGPIASRFGGVRPNGSGYATHPPLIVVETAAAELLGGERPAATRAPAWLGALGTIPLLFLLLRRLGLDDLPAAATTVGGLGCHLFLTYGLMLDTMVVALPFAVGLLLVVQRRWDDDPLPPAVELGVAATAALAGWQGVFLVGLCTVAVAARRPVLRAWPFAAGGGFAVALTLGWSVWVHGGLGVLEDKLTRRSGAATGVGDMVRFQLPWLAQLLGVGLLLSLGCVAALADRRWRPVAALSLASVVLYDLALREGAGGHQYWSYWAVVPATVGLGFVVQRAGRRYGTPAALVLCGVALAANLAQPDEAGDRIDGGRAAHALVARTRLPDGQTDLPYVAEPYRIDDWVRYAGFPSGSALADAAAVRALAATHPDHLVLVLGTCADDDTAGICSELTFGQDPQTDATPPRMETAAALAARLP